MSFSYEEGHVNDQVLVKVALNVRNSSPSQLMERGEISHRKQGCFRKIGGLLGPHEGWNPEMAKPLATEAAIYSVLGWEHTVLGLLLSAVFCAPFSPEV